MTSTTDGPRRRTLAGQATLYADRGWHVFPLSPGSKKPLPGGDGQDDATNDVEQVLEWWSDFPEANIGVHCRPSGLYVVDLDRHAKGVDGVETWRRLIGEHGGTEPTATVRTAGGGFHLYYRAPAGVELSNTAGKLGPGVDTRGNGYVVAPPSVVGGRLYEPTSPPRRVAELPAWVIEALTPPPPRPYVAPSRPPNPDAVWRRVQDLAAELANAPVGEGNNTAARVAHMVGQYVGAGQYVRETALDVLADAVSGWTWRRSSDHRTMLGTIERQLDAGAASPRPWQ